MARSRSVDIDFGPLEKTVRWFEESAPEAFDEELERRLNKLRPDGCDPFLRAAACAAARSTRFEGTGRVPHGLLVLAPARSLLTGISDPERLRKALRPALRLVNREIHHPGFGPYRMLDFSEVPGDGKEGTLFSFLEAVRAGETDWADHRFAWLVRNLEKEQVIDLLLSSGLECVAEGMHKVVGVVEVVSLLHGLGWEWAPVWLRPIVRHQASGLARQEEYDRCRALVAGRDLLRLARRRPPGQPSLGERDPDGFLQQAMRWAEANPPARTDLVAQALADGTPLEDAGDLIGIGAVLLFLQESLGRREAAQDEAELDRRMHLVTGVLALCRLVRLGTPGQRILGLLLAGWVSPVREVQLAPRAPDSGWWLPTIARLLEPAAAPAEEPELPLSGAWAENITAGQSNGLLPLLTGRLEAGGTAAPLEPVLCELAPTLEVSGGLALKLERTLAEAYRGSRTPHRWLYLWASALALTLWPRESRTRDLPPREGIATMTPQG